MSNLAAARLSKELAAKAAQHENVVSDLSQAWTLEGVLRSRIAELEERLRTWRDDYVHSADGLTVAVPVYQIINLIGEKP